MMFIHEHSDWPAFSWEAEALGTLLGNVRYAQGLLLGRMAALGFDLQTEASLEVQTSDVVKSAAIEGEMLDPSAVRSSVARRLGIESPGVSPMLRQVEGIVEMMLDATQNHDQPLTRDRLFGWHAALFPTGRSGLRSIEVGAWRTADRGPMQVVSGSPGREFVHFQAPEAIRLDREMTRFFDWFNHDDSADPVLKAGIAHFWFVTIHPFEDGNGRIARAIADMALARADGVQRRFYSMSSQIERERRTYYLTLETAQRGDLDITHWLDWFLGCLGRAIQGAETALSEVLRKSVVWQLVNRHPINERQRLVVNRMLNGFKGFLTTSKYAKLARCSSDTALRDIRELLAYGILIKNPGRGRSTSYRLVEPDETG